MILLIILNDTDFENLRRVKRILVKKIGEHNVSKLIDVMSIVDNLCITLTIVELQDILNKTNTLRENLLYFISFRHFVVSNCESN